MIAIRLRAGAVLAGLLGGLAGCDDGTSTPLQVVNDDPVDRPLRNSSPADLALFDRGDTRFDRVFTPAAGLGPLYIRAACSSCHSEAGRGPGQVQKMAPVDPEGHPPATALPFGPTARPFTAVAAATPLLPPEGGWDGPLQLSVRLGPALWGRGYIEAIADAEIERVEVAQAARGDAIAGRANRVTYHSVGVADPAFGIHRHGDMGLIGRFGLKARVASIDDFTADAFQSDMGLTSPMRPQELANPDGLSDDLLPGTDVTMEAVVEVAAYGRRLEIPSRDPSAASSEALALFDQAACSACHVPALHTRADYPIAVLADIDAPVYTDLLLHDMGDALADGVVDEAASGREWRTAPLIGIRFFHSLLHDGRAHSVDEAIRLHGGPGSQANDSVARYATLTEAARALLVRFVTSL